MKAEFDIKLSVQDMYRFSMYHNYTGFQGIFSILIGIVAWVMAVLTRDRVDTTYTILYILFGLVFLCYMPVSLYLSSKRQIGKSKQLQEPLHYTIDENGVTVSQNDSSATLSWNQVYKITATKHNVLIYSSRVYAYIIPREQLGEQFELVKTISKSNLEKCRFCIRK